MSFKDHFSKQSKAYAKYRPSYPEALFQFLSDQTKAHDQVWDCATGSGQAALKLVDYFSKVFATDASASQLERATAHAKIEYALCLAEKCPLPDQSVDLVTVANGAHWFELEPFYAEVRRVLKPGGLIAIWCYNGSHSDSGVHKWMQKLEREVLAEYWAEPIKKWVQTHYETIPFPFETIVAPSFKMEISWTLEKLLGYLSSWSATQRYKDTHGEDPLLLDQDELRAIFDRESGELTSVYGVHLRVGRHSG